LYCEYALFLVASSLLYLFCPFFFFSWCAVHRDLHSFPTRRSSDLDLSHTNGGNAAGIQAHLMSASDRVDAAPLDGMHVHAHKVRSEEHTSELQSRGHLVCRLLLEKKKLDKKRAASDSYQYTAHEYH